MTVTTLCACALTVCLPVFLRSAHEFAAQLKSALIRVHREKRVNTTATTWLFAVFVFALS